MLDNIASGIISGILFISLAVLFCILLIKLYIRKIKNYTAVIYQKDIDFQKSLNTAIIETQEQVLNNISQDLHDDAGQQLTYINFQLENLKLDSAEMQQTLQPLSESVRQLSGSIRSISHSLNNQLLLQQDLVKAIAGEVERLQKNAKIGIALSVKGKKHKDFSIDEKIVIYRIFQEIISNIFKHSAATQVSIQMRLQPFFEMQITDNGKGFHPQNIQTKPALGLQNMEHRANGIGYGLKIVSEPGNGTRITLSENKNP
jgi:signal transduction histidine kinase